MQRIRRPRSGWLEVVGGKEWRCSLEKGWIGDGESRPEREVNRMNVGIGFGFEGDEFALRIS
jgi:hypothetical protein